MSETKHNVPIQSLIDHIKTAQDVDPWAKEMAEKILKGQEPDRSPKRVKQDRECEVYPNVWVRKGFCPQCHQTVHWLTNRQFCGFCGQALMWNA